ncbi:photosystem II reaction center protein PsbH [Acaryochloris sp. IP29b_bin.148]|uniref:photosystem II reaction center phosphoprotein PsbH n=1 Tax=Acaryochloris sp. IP29b_bin.148 TaxID=2969218 RepID=UPI0026335465|nr:photosystem II reaction center protein PsbH [Acaryochloris sp. IP29b_bin.148]
MPKQTWWGDVLKGNNSEAGKFAPGWGTTPVMAGFVVMITLLLLIMLQIYNSTIVLDGVDNSWTSLGGFGQ